MVSVEAEEKCGVLAAEARSLIVMHRPTAT